MTLFADFWFFVVLAILAIPAVILGVKQRPLKYYTFAATLIFVALAMYKSPKALVYLVLFCLLEFAAVKGYLYLRQAHGRKALICWGFVIVALLPLTVNKIFVFVHLNIFGFLGISYLTFKAVQMVIEIYDGLIERVNFFEFISFMLFFPAITSGPIDRSRRYAEDFNSIPDKDDYLTLLGNGLFKIMLGMAYKFVVAAAFYQLLLIKGMGFDLTSALIYMYSYGFYLFFDFAGYSLMAIGTAYIFGIKMPENFNKPFISKDIKEFWDRWHITLSHWFRDFIFSRFMMQCIRHKWFKSKLTGASIGFIINMTLMGIWHGLDLQYILYGVYHGVLLAITEVYQKKSRFHKKHKKEKWYKFISWFITFNLVMFGFFIFSGRFTCLLGC